MCSKACSIGTDYSSGPEVAAASIPTVSALAFIVCAIWVGLDLEPRLYAQRSSAEKLWQVEIDVLVPSSPGRQKPAEA